NLLFVRDRLLRTDADLAPLLEFYQRVRDRRREPDDETNPLCSLVKLSGVASVQQPGRSLRPPNTETGIPCLRVRNRIYHRVFDRAWVRAHMPDAEVRRQRSAYLRGVRRTAGVATAVVAAVGWLGLVALQQAGRANAERKLALRRERIALEEEL